MASPFVQSVANLLVDRFPRRDVLRSLSAGGLIALITAIAGRARADASPIAPPLVQNSYPLDSSASLELDRSDLRETSLTIKWTVDGSLVSYDPKSLLPHNLAAQAASYGAALNALAPGLIQEAAKQSGFNWEPYRGLVIFGGNWAAVVGSGNEGHLIDTKQVDLTQIIDRLLKAEGT